MPRTMSECLQHLRATIWHHKLGEPAKPCCCRSAWQITGRYG